jgi:hypothetical protein
MELKTPNFCFLVARASDAPMPLHCQCPKDVVSTLQFFARGVNFDEDGVEKNWQERVVLGEIFSVDQLLVLFITSFEYLQIFRGNLITTDFKKKHVELFSIFFYASTVFMSRSPTPTLREDALCGALFLLEQKKVPPPPAIVMSATALSNTSPCMLDGAIPPLYARHEKQHLLFFAEVLIWLQRWHFHSAARAVADLSVLGIPLRQNWK